MVRFSIFSSHDRHLCRELTWASIGQGACQAIESGFALAHILKHWQTPDLGDAFSADIPEEHWATAFSPTVAREHVRWLMEFDLLGELASKLTRRFPNL